MQKWIFKVAAIPAILCVSLNAYSVGPGFYLGLTMGPVKTSSGNQLVQTDSGTLVEATAKSNNFGVRPYLGYQMNDHVAFEMGLDYFGKFKYNTPKDVNPCKNPHAKLTGLDGMIKGIMPIGEAFDVHAKIGVAYTYQTISGSLNPDLSKTCGSNLRQTKFAPVFTIGAGYTFNQNWTTALSWERMMASGVIKTIDFYGIGLSYHFVDKYCGQFLCDD